MFFYTWKQKQQQCLFVCHLFYAIGLRSDCDPRATRTMFSKSTWGEVREMSTHEAVALKGPLEQHCYGIELTAEEVIWHGGICQHTHIPWK